jgi:hypothetical protein
VSSPIELATGAPGDDGQLRQGGRSLLLALYTALRSLKLYPLENATERPRPHYARVAQE